jgi:hypothetical protein
MLGRDDSVRIAAILDAGDRANRRLADPFSRHSYSSEKKSRLSDHPLMVPERELSGQARAP